MYYLLNHFPAPALAWAAPGTALALWAPQPGGPSQVGPARCAQPGGPSQVGPARWAKPGGPSQVGPARWAQPGGPKIKCLGDLANKFRELGNAIQTWKTCPRSRWNACWEHPIWDFSVLLGSLRLLDMDTDRTPSGPNEPPEPPKPRREQAGDGLGTFFALQRTERASAPPPPSRGGKAARVRVRVHPPHLHPNISEHPVNISGVPFGGRITARNDAGMTLSFLS
eukprot:gene10734-biopygen3314